MMRSDRSILFVMATAMMCACRAAGDAAGAETKLSDVIVFSSNRSGSWVIWAMSPQPQSPMRQITKPAAGEQDVDPAISPDGMRLLFTSTRGGKPGLWTVKADGSDVQRICDGEQGTWSPDGKQIALRRGGKLTIRELGSGNEKVISPDGWEKCSGPSWSPDGASIAFAHLNGESNAVYVVKVDGGKPVKVYDKQGACQPRWSPDGRSIVYETETHLCTINPDGTKNRLITWYGGVQRYARFSPDGKRIVFCQAASPEGPWELYIAPATGGAPTRLTEGGSDMYPDWK